MRVVLEHKENVCVACEKAKVLKCTDGAIYLGCEEMKKCKKKEEVRD